MRSDVCVARALVLLLAVAVGIKVYITKAAAGALPGAALGMMGDGLKKATGGVSDKVGNEAGNILGGLGGKDGVGKLFGR